MDITSNLVDMAKAAGLYECLWCRMPPIKAGELIEPLSKGLERLKSDPARFTAFNPKNGWGDYSSFVSWISDCVDACRKWPDAEVRRCG